jgi:uncharacterized protein (UPF0332 family)
LDPKFHRYLIEAFDRRITADYDVTVRLGPEEAAEAVTQAKESAAAAEQYLNTLEK